MAVVEIYGESRFCDQHHGVSDCWVTDCQLARRYTWTMSIGRSRQGFNNRSFEGGYMKKLVLTEASLDMKKLCFFGALLIAATLFVTGSFMSTMSL